MDDMTLEYSWSDGQYWSQYNHCRVWKNGTYKLKVRDKYGQTSTTAYEVVNNHKAIIPSPTVKGENVQEYGWTTTNPIIQFYDPSGAETYYIDVKFTPEENWNLATSKGNRGIGVSRASGIKTLMGRCRDDYGNVSLPITFVCGVDDSAPTNINFVPTLSIANEIHTTVSAIENVALPLKYSITYDGGQTWSTPQIGRNFGLVNNPPKGTYTINCRAYNAAGLYVEGSPVQVTII